MGLMRTIGLVVFLWLGSLARVDAQCDCFGIDPFYVLEAGWLESKDGGGSPLYDKLKVTISQKPSVTWDPQGDVRIRHIYWSDTSNPSINGTFEPSVFGVSVINLSSSTSGSIELNVIYEDDEGTEIDIDCTTLVSCAEGYFVNTSSSTPPDPVIHPSPVAPIPDASGVVAGTTAFYPPFELISHGRRVDSNWMTPSISRVLLPNNQHAIGNLTPGHFFSFDYRVTVYPDPSGVDAMILFDPLTGQSVYFEDSSVNGTANDGTYEPENNVYFREAYLTDSSNAASNSPEDAGSSQLFVTVKRRNGVEYRFELVDAPRFDEEPVTPVGRLVSITELNGFATTFTYKTFTSMQIEESPRRQLQIHAITDGFGSQASVTYESTQQSGRWVIDGITVNRVAGANPPIAGPTVDELDYNYSDGQLFQVEKNSVVKSEYAYGVDSVWQAATIEWTEEDWTHDRNGTLFLSADYMVWGQHLINQFAACIVGRGAGRDSDNDGDYDEVVRYLTVLRDPTEGSRFRLIYNNAVIQWEAGRYLRYFSDPNPDEETDGYAKYDSGTLETSYAQHPSITNAQVLMATPPTLVDATGYEVTQTYDSDGNPETTTFPDTTTEVRVYDSENRLVYSKARNSSVREWEYSSGNLIRVKNGMSGSYGSTSVSSSTSSNQVVMTYNGFGQIATIATTPVGASAPTADQRYDLTYDEFGRLTQVQLPLAEGQASRSSITHTWDFGLPETQTDVSGDTRAFTFDALHRLVKTEFNDGTMEETKYDDGTGLAYHRNRAGIVSRVYRNTANQLLSVTSPYGYADDLDTATVTVFDHADRSIDIFTYVANSNLPLYRDRNGARTSIGYDYRSRSNVVTVQPRDSFHRTVTTTFANNLPFKEEQEFYSHYLRKYFAFEEETSGNPRKIRTIQTSSVGTTFSDPAAVLAASLSSGANPAYVVRELKFYPTDSKLEQIFPNGSRFVEEYDALGNLTAEELYDSLAATTPSMATSNVFDTQGRLSQVTDSGGLISYYAYDAASKLKTITAPGSKVYKIKYLADGRIGSIEMPESTGGTPVIVQPNLAGLGNGSKANATDEGLIVNRDSLGRIVHVASVSDVSTSAATKLNPKNEDTLQEITYRYAPNGKLEYKTVWHSALDAAIDVEDPAIAGLGSTDPEDGVTTQYVYDSAMFDSTGLSGATGQAVVRPDGSTIYISISAARSKLAQATTSGGASTAFTWNRSGSAQAEIAPDGETMIVRIYDGLERIVMKALMKKPASGATWTLVNWECYWRDRVENTPSSVASETVVIVDSTSKTRKVRVSGLGDPVNLVDENNKVTKYESDELGNVVKLTDALGKFSTFEYDNLGRLLETESPESQTVSMAYGTSGTSNGLLTSITDAKSNSGTFSYNTLGENEYYEDRKSLKSWNYFDASTGLQNKFRDAQGKETLYGYDLNRRLNQLTFSDSSVMGFDHDALGRLKEQISPSDKRQLFTYNLDGSLDKVEYKSTGGSSVTYKEEFTQDDFGRTVKAETFRSGTPEVTNTVNSFDDFGLVDDATTSFNSQDHDVSIVRNSLGQITSITYPSGKVLSYTYRPAGQVGTITWDGTQIEARYYDDAGQLTSINRYGGMNETRTYDDAGRLTNISNIKGGTTQLSATYTYDANNNLTGEALTGYSGGGNHSYSTIDTMSSNPDGFDAEDDRVRWLQPAISRTITLVRSNIGNIVTFTLNGSSSGRTYDNAHALLTFLTGNTQVYDADGNLTTAADGSTLVWDEAGRLKQINYANGDVDQFGYDALGRRAWKFHNPSGQSVIETVYIYLGYNCIAECLSDGTILNEYLYAEGIDSLVMVSRNNDTERYGVLRSARWNVLALHDMVTYSNGIVERYSYDIFGERSIWAANGTTSRSVSSYGMEIGNTSSRHDKKFIYMRNRYYDPKSGEFISRDPLGFVDGSSLYRGYFNASGVDPLGLQETNESIAGAMTSSDGYKQILGDPLFHSLMRTHAQGMRHYGHDEKWVVERAMKMYWEIKINRAANEIEQKRELELLKETLRNEQDGGHIADHWLVDFAPPPFRLIIYGDKSAKEIAEQRKKRQELTERMATDGNARYRDLMDTYLAGPGTEGLMYAGVDIYSDTFMAVLFPGAVFGEIADTAQDIKRAARVADGAPNSAFEIAQQGGKHAGFLKNYVGKPASQIQKGIRSIEREIADHLDKIANPRNHVPEWDTLDPRRQDALLNKIWPSDIARQREQLDILQGLLRSMGGGS